MAELIKDPESRKYLKHYKESPVEIDLKTIAKDYSEILTRNLNNKLTIETANGIHASLIVILSKAIEDDNNQRAVSKNNESS